MNFIIKIALVTIVLIFMSACESPKGGVITEDTSKTTKVTGIVVDGYISGSVVYMDLNSNGYWEEGEPKVTTATDGSFSFPSISLEKDSLVPIVSLGGRDTATNKVFQGKLRKIVDTSILADNSTVSYYVTPLTDLISTYFLSLTTKDSKTLSISTQNISAVYGINTDIINLNPMAYAGVFAKTQEIQQTKALLETSIIKAKNDILTNAELELLRYNIKKAIVLQINEFNYLNLSQVLLSLEDELNVTIPSNEKNFIAAQKEEVKRTLTSFASTDNNVTIENLNAFQLELENKQEYAYNILKDANETDLLSVVPLNIDVFVKPTPDPDPIPDPDPTPDPTPEVVSLNGTVIDGYIEGATVCLDLDFNGICSYSEPSTITSVEGNFTFNNLEIYKDKFLSIISSGGKDTANNKDYIGELKAILDTNNIETFHKFNITPITDLISTSFLESSVQNITLLDSYKENVATTYRIAKELTDKLPTDDRRVFAIIQEIQQTKSLIEVSAIKAKGIGLTVPQRKELQEKITQATISVIDDSADLDVKNVISSLEEMIDISIADNEKEFIVDQIREIKLALDYFIQHGNLTMDNFDTYQVALENEADKIYTLLQSIDGNDTINLMMIIIDIFDTPDINNTTPDNNVSSPDINGTDTNTTLPVDKNTTVISFSGVVVDDYISEATVCVDLDYSGVCTSIDPFTSTDENGTYKFSNIEVTEGIIVPVIGFQGIDTSTNKTYPGDIKALINTDEIAEDDLVLISPLIDLISVRFLEKNSNLNEIYKQTITNIAEAFGLSDDEILTDPMQDINIFVLSQTIEHIKRIIQLVVKNTNVDIETKYLQDKIKKVLITQILELQYIYLNVDNVLAVLEIDFGIVISEENKSFVSKQITEIKRVLDILSQSENIYVHTLPRIQWMLENDLESAYNDINYTNLSMTEESVIYSIFNKEDAIYDDVACNIDEDYKYKISDTNISTEVNVDLYNGITIRSDINSTSIYYPDLEIEKNGENVHIFKDDYYFSFDKAWTEKKENIYIEVFNQDEDNYSCYRANLNSDISSEINLVKVYRYSN